MAELNPTPPRPGFSLPRRFLFHGALFLGYVAIAAAIFIWPNSIAEEGARTAVEIQQDRLQELEDRHAVQRAMNSRLREWRNQKRRVFLEPELDAFPREVRAAAQREGVHAAKIALAHSTVARWRRTLLASGELEDEETGRVEPRTVRIVLTGPFSNVYRTVANLCGGQKLFIPDRWDLSSISGDAAGGVRAEIQASVFVVHEPEETPGQPGAKLALAEASP